MEVEEEERQQTREGERRGGAEYSGKKEGRRSDRERGGYPSRTSRGKRKWVKMVVRDGREEEKGE